jgi:predicted DNA-binding protein (UPF0251 family)
MVVEPVPDTRRWPPAISPQPAGFLLDKMHICALWFSWRLHIRANKENSMRRAYRKRRVHTPPRFGHFKPVGVPRRVLNQIEVTLDEYEAIRLADYEGLEHLEASERMDISRPTFTRLVEKARRKVAQSIIEGKELVIGGGNFDFVNTLHHCRDCGEITSQPIDDDTDHCHDCGSENIENLAERFAGRGCEGGRKRHRKRQDEGKCPPGDAGRPD